jgi:hypothetical protein
MPLDPEALYVQLGRLLEAMPDLTENARSAESHRWLARAYALAIEAGEHAGAIAVTQKQPYLASPNPAQRQSAAAAISAVVQRALAVAELRAPAAAQGAFIPAGNAFDALAAIGKVLAQAGHDLLIVDPYMDEKVLTDFAPLAAEDVTLRLLADQQHHKPTLKPAVTRWQAQYGAARPLEARLAAPRTLHDRLILVDRSEVWLLTQSLNAFAARAPASIVRVEGDAVPLKLAAYQAMWDAATPM